jgi:hypothetical protein
MELGDGVREPRRGEERSHRMRWQRDFDLAPGRPAREREEEEKAEAVWIRWGSPALFSVRFLGAPSLVWFFSATTLPRFFSAG